MKRALRNVAAILILLTGIYFAHEGRKTVQTDLGRSFAGRRIECVIDLARYDDSTKILLTGYNYALLKDFANAMSSEIAVRVPEKGENYADSLMNGDIDIRVIPYRHGNFNADGAMASDPVDSLTVWLINSNELNGIMDVNHWLDDYHKSNLYKKYHRQYVHTFHDPYSEADLGLKRSEISPYDSLFKAYASKIGWNWKLLAALSFKESKFRIDAKSNRGATGLMQMVPVTADRFELEDLLDPEENIRVGVTYLDWLRKTFAKRIPEDSPDMPYFVLASYNCGEGHLIDCINFAKSKGVFDGSWSSVCHIFPEMSQSETASADSSVRLGSFNAENVANYVDEVLAIKEAFDEMYPDI